MTKRLTLVGLAAVAVVWGPFVYSELARRPVSASSSEPHAIEPAEPVEVTPVVFAPAPSPQPAQPASPATVTVIEPAAEPPPPAAPVESEPAAQPPEAEEPAVVAQPVHHPPEPSVQPAEPVAQAEPAQPPAAEENAPKPEPEQPAENAATPEANSAAAAQAIALAPQFRSTFDSESRDAQWAEHEEPRLTQLLATSGIPASAVSEVRCQSTVCRVSFSQSDLEHTSPLQLAGLVQKVREEFGPSLALDPAKRENGDQAAAFYVLRKGFELGRRDSL